MKRLQQRSTLEGVTTAGVYQSLYRLVTIMALPYNLTERFELGVRGNQLFPLTPSLARTHHCSDAHPGTLTSFVYFHR